MKKASNPEPPKTGRPPPPPAPPPIRHINEDIGGGIIQILRRLIRNG